MVDPISLEVFKNLFVSVSEEMGVALQRTAYSPNMKERLDFSCAIFDPDGAMVAQAAHIPVHLGAMPFSVAAAINPLVAGLVLVTKLEGLILPRAGAGWHRHTSPDPGIKEDVHLDGRVSPGVQDFSPNYT